MNAALAFWTGSLFLFAAMLASALLAWRHVRRGRIDLHRRWINTAIILLVLFLTSYVVKVLLLGKENLATWSPGSLFILRLHETVVLLMLLSGGTARFLARRVGKGEEAPPWHRWCGRTAILSGIAAFLTATMVLVGMYQRVWGAP